MVWFFFFFFKQKTAYEMRISDWSSDVCSSDLMTRAIDQTLAQQGLGRAHHRALYFISRQPGLTVSELLKLLAITKQSLGRVLNDLFERGYIQRSEERRVGKECVRTCRSRWSPYN